MNEFEDPRLSLTHDRLPPRPETLFASWWRAALERPVPEPTAAVLATAARSGRPSARVVLVKGGPEGGFLFFSNYDSRKGIELRENPRASLCFFWQALRRQVRVEGRVETAPEEVSDAYFRTRPRGSQIGAWASRQSRELPSRSALEARVAEYEARFAGREVPRPPHWGGFLLHPDVYEFWAHRDDRLHDRVRYVHTASGWSRGLLQP